MINRAAIIIRLKAPAVQWINDADPRDDSHEITLESANRERTVYLIKEEDADDDKTLKKWIKMNYETLFESELEGWYTVERMWPQNRTLKLFHEWFDIECNSVIEDTVGTPIVDEDF